MWQQRLFGDGRGRVFLTRALDPIIECRGIEMEEFCYGGGEFAARWIGWESKRHG